MGRLVSAPRSPWQRAYVERLIGSIRRECLDHVIAFDESSIRRILASYFDYYHRSRTHLSLGKDSPEPRLVQPREIAPVVAVPQVGGLHHRYETPTDRQITNVDLGVACTDALTRFSLDTVQHTRRTQRCRTL
jgi:hypothetical protein